MAYKGDHFDRILSIDILMNHDVFLDPNWINRFCHTKDGLRCLVDSYHAELIPMSTCNFKKNMLIIFALSFSYFSVMWLLQLISAYFFSDSWLGWKWYLPEVWRPILLECPKNVGAKSDWEQTGEEVIWFDEGGKKKGWGSVRFFFFF